MGAPVVAAIILRRERDLVAHFRRAGAVSAARAQTPGELGVDQRLAWRRLVNRAVIRQTPNGTYYLDELSWEALRRIRRRVMAVVAVLVLLMIGVVVAMHGQTGSPVPSAIPKEAVVKTHATGPFDVKLAPQTVADTTVAATIGRMSIDKQYHGDLEASGKGEMLTAGTGVANSAGYVAIERVSGSLHGRKGTFVLQHSGTMTRGAPQLSVTVVPDSGTGELVGLTGTMMIIIAGGKHSYDFEYTLAK